MCLGEGFTNNTTEYEGILEALRRILRIGHPAAVLEGDTLLIISQLLGKFAVRAENLKPYFRDAMLLIRMIRQGGQQLTLRHIYREFNTIADHHANVGADGTTGSHMWSDDWPQ